VRGRDDARDIAFVDRGPIAARVGEEFDIAIGAPQR
jgi:hypothetical protein